MALKTKHVCAKCHFLAKAGATFRKSDCREVTVQNRDSIRASDYSWLGGGDLGPALSVGCYFGVWVCDMEVVSYDIGEAITKINRKDFCFFWKHRPGMLFEAAEILQKREADNRESARDRRLAIIGLYIAGLALVSGLALEVVRTLGVIQ